MSKIHPYFWVSILLEDQQIRSSFLNKNGQKGKNSRFYEVRGKALRIGLTQGEEDPRGTSEVVQEGGFYCELHPVSSAKRHTTKIGEFPTRKVFRTEATAASCSLTASRQERQPTYHQNW